MIRYQKFAIWHDIPDRYGKLRPFLSRTLDSYCEDVVHVNAKKGVTERLPQHDNCDDAHNGERHEKQDNLGSIIRIAVHLFLADALECRPFDWNCCVYGI